jgi:hypothetical protein
MQTKRQGAAVETNFLQFENEILRRQRIRHFHCHAGLVSSFACKSEIADRHQGNLQQQHS